MLKYIIYLNVVGYIIYTYNSIILDLMIVSNIYICVYIYNLKTFIIIMMSIVLYIEQIKYLTKYLTN